ncbi:flagellar hook assembly protein FlgD [Shouchella patagoniensis]|uniref:flagellar hook assembly protein FlgD n=1 Tax=Shouchella patagoniensis TaxID=228576 RepID=UPI0009953650|nr:flagellar hook assembly protein FlgD [Shouchella patagoniensis]
MTQIDPSLLLSSQTNQTRQPGNVLGQDAFLKLLLTQMQNQDPTNPMDDREFIAQLATFSSLEQLTQMNQTAELLYFEQKSQQLMAISDLIGKEVSWRGEESNQESSGKVTAVKYNEKGEIIVQIEEDEWISSSKLISIMGSKSTNEEKGNE